MKKMGTTYLVLGLSVLLAVIVVLLAWSGRRGTREIVLPEGPADADGGGTGQESLDVVEITPDTVRTAIATLSRPQAYSQNQTVETFWSGGSGQSVSRVSVSGGRTRIDTRLPDGSVRHMLFAGDLAAVWYDDETDWIVRPVQELTPDMAARMLSYEDVVQLPSESIHIADYRELEGARCIYVETGEDAQGYAGRYWVDVDTGLLRMAERTQNGETVYRFTAEAPESGAAEESLFLLPDGGALGQQTLPESQQTGIE